jgi:DNA-binding IclR family transcriptional regulator
MMEVLGQIESSGDGLTIRELTGRLGLPRTAVYRILNTLQA